MAECVHKRSELDLAVKNKYDQSADSGVGRLRELSMRLVGSCVSTSTANDRQDYALLRFSVSIVDFCSILLLLLTPFPFAAFKFAGLSTFALGLRISRVLFTIGCRTSSFFTGFCYFLGGYFVRTGSFSKLRLTGMVFYESLGMMGLALSVLSISPMGGLLGMGGIFLWLLGSTELVAVVRTVLAVSMALILA